MMIQNKIDQNVSLNIETSKKGSAQKYPLLVSIHCQPYICTKVYVLMHCLHKLVTSEYIIKDDCVLKHYVREFQSVIQRLKVVALSIIKLFRV